MTHDAAYYASLDYSRWSRRQRLVQRAIAVFVHSTMRVHVDGLEHLPASGPAIIAGNHLSLLDSVVVIPYLRRPVILLLAEELRVWPWIGLVLGRLGNAILVRRGSGERRPVELGAAVLEAGGIVAVAPEGRRSRSGGLQRGRNGVARLVIRTGAPVVPLAIWGQEHAFRSWRRLRRAPVEVRFAPPPPLGTSNGSALAAVTARVMREIAGLLPPEYRGHYADR
jgi:1-acyl-sn-glycerol-3-phosphate acyltransferase